MHHGQSELRTKKIGKNVYDMPDILSLICGLVGIAIFVYTLIRILKSRNDSADWVTGIWFSGLIAFLIRLPGQLYNIGEMFEALSEDHTA